jgi:putative intracellular protease/amidase
MKAVAHSGRLRMLRRGGYFLGLALAILAAGAHTQARAEARGTASVITNTMLSGTRFGTEYYVHDSGNSGPTMFVVGGVHGNEPAGAAAAEAIRHWPLIRGKLVVVPRANVPALEANKRLTPGLGTNLSNLNRNFPRAGEGGGARGELAEAIWKLAIDSKPDWVIDLHEGYDFSQANQKSVGSSIIVHRNEAGLKAADRMLEAVNRTIPEPEMQFVRRLVPVDGSLARAAGEHLRVPAMILETTSKQPLQKRVSQHETMVSSLLAHLNMLGNAPEVLASHAGKIPEPGFSRPVIAIYEGAGTGGAGPTNLLRRLNRSASTSAERITSAQIQAGALTNYQVVIFAGGSASQQAEALTETGRKAVQDFVAGGGGYIGICAGAYLASSGFSWGLNLIDARTVSPKWQRGRGTIKIELSEQGREVLGDRPGQLDCLYVNGPIVKPAEIESLPDYETLAWFRTELAENDSPKGAMVDSPAIFAAPYKSGRVLCVSPHPEQTQGLEDIIPRAVEWVTRRAASAEAH